MYTSNWKIIILIASSFSGHRVKRIDKKGGAIMHLPGSQQPETSGSFPGPEILVAANSTLTLIDPGTNQQTQYIFAFWSFIISDTITGSRTAYTSFAPDFNDISISDLTGHNFNVDAIAWYIFDIMTRGEGDNGIYIDAFDSSINDFIGDDFVYVAPDPLGLITKEANDGEIDTDIRIPKPQSMELSTTLRITAAQYLAQTNGPTRVFQSWKQVKLLQYHDPISAAPLNPINRTDIIVGYNDIVVAFAFYIDDPNYKPKPIKVVNVQPQLVLGQSDAGWVLMPLGAGPDTGPGDTYLKLLTALQQIVLAKSASKSGRTEMLGSAEKFILSAAESIKIERN